MLSKSGSRVLRIWFIIVCVMLLTYHYMSLVRRPEHPQTPPPPSSLFDSEQGVPPPAEPETHPSFDSGTVPPALFDSEQGVPPPAEPETHPSLDSGKAVPPPPLPPPPPPPPPAAVQPLPPSHPLSVLPPSHSAIHEIVSGSKTAVLYPPDYLPIVKDDEECEALYSSRYLEYIASHHTQYCEDGSRSVFECFRTHRNETTCLASGVLMDQTREEPNKKMAMHCQLRNFTVEIAKSPDIAKALYGVLNVEDMPSGYFDTGPPWQLKSWDVNTKDSIMAMGAGEICGPGKSDGKWTLLVKRENKGNIWHKLMELWQAMVTLDVLQMAVDPLTKKPYLLPSDIPKIQVVFTSGDNGFVDGIDTWWEMVTGNRPILQDDMAPTCLGKVILPLAGSYSPFWANQWKEKDCHNTFLLDAFLKRVYRHIGITPEKHGDQTGETIVTIIDRKGKRKLANLEGHVADARARWPRVNFQVVDFAAMSLEQQVALTRRTDVLLGLHGAGLTHALWLPEESSLAEIQPPNRRMPEGQPSTGFRNLAKMRNLHYFTAHPEKRDGDGEWVEVKGQVFAALIDAAINAQIHKGLSQGEVQPPVGFVSYTPSDM